MSQPHGPKQLRRSRSDRYVGGVCGGVASYLNMDPTLVRVLTVALTLFTGVPVVLYLVALFLMPEEDVVPAPYDRSVGRATDPVWGPDGPPWERIQPTPPAWGSSGVTDPVPTAPPAPHDPPRREPDAS